VTFLRRRRRRFGGALQPFHAVVEVSTVNQESAKASRRLEPHDRHTCGRLECRNRFSVQTLFDQPRSFFVLRQGC
jgi:hypothetical protein